MQITVRTYDEVSNERVRIEVAPGQRADIQIVDDRVSTYDPARLYTAEEVGDLQASEAELVAARLRRQIQELEAEARERESRIEELGAQLRKARAQVSEYDRDRKRERDRADGNKGWAERAEQRLADQAQAWAERADRQLADQAEEHRQSLAARDAILSTSVRKINSAREMLTVDEVVQARRMDLTRTGTTMSHAIGAALRVLDQA